MSKEANEEIDGFGMFMLGLMSDDSIKILKSEKEGSVRKIEFHINDGIAECIERELKRIYPGKTLESHSQTILKRSLGKLKGMNKFRDYMVTFEDWIEQ